MSKATHKGTCQICGRSQKLPQGALSKHGYTTRWGFFSGVCTGARHTPFEESYDLISDIIVRCEREVEDLDGHIESLEASEDCAVVEFSWYESGRFGHRERQHSKQTTKVEMVDHPATEDGYVNHEVFIYYEEKGETNRVSLSHPNGYKGVQCSGYTPTVKAAVDALNQHEIWATKKRIKQLEEYIVWQTDRVTNWKPGKLTPVS